MQLASPLSAPLIVQYGWQPLLEPAESKVLAAATPTADGAVSIEWKAAPCGPVWIRAGIDLDGSGLWKPKGGTCEGAGPEGKLTLHRTAGAEAARCVLRAP